MPHIVVKTIKGPSKQQIQEAAEEIKAVVNRRLGKPDKYISVSVEEYGFDEWPAVYDAFVKGKDNVVIQPGYTNPETFQ